MPATIHPSIVDSGRVPILADPDYFKGLGSSILGAPMDIVNLLADLVPPFDETKPYKDRFGTTEYFQDLLGADLDSSASLAGILSSIVTSPETAVKAAPLLINILKKDKGEGLASLLNKESLFHGSPINKLKTLNVPKGEGTEHLSQGGVYLTRGKGDPRLGQFAPMPYGSVYEAKPSFTRTLDPRQLPADERKILSKGIGKDLPLIKTMKNLNRDIPQIQSLLKDKYNLNEIHYPARISQRFAEEVKDLGYDSLLYPKVKTPMTRSGKKPPNYRETVIALDPDNTLDIIDETNVGDFIRIMLRNADRSY
tara:strand:- start:515 stop:1444 length:930 start_codon:yes stop_codon:yes gene_type:complete